MNGWWLAVKFTDVWSAVPCASCRVVSSYDDSDSDTLNEASIRGFTADPMAALAWVRSGTLP